MQHWTSSPSPQRCFLTSIFSLIINEESCNERQSSDQAGRPEGSLKQQVQNKCVMGERLHLDEHTLCPTAKVSLVAGGRKVVMFYLKGAKMFLSLIEGRRKEVSGPSGDNITTCHFSAMKALKKISSYFDFNQFISFNNLVYKELLGFRPSVHFFW